MKRKLVNEIFIDEVKRKHKIILLVIFICIVTFISLAFGYIYLTKNKTEYINYTENSNVDYKVYLKENNFFDKDYVEQKKQYIASLIDYINTDFKYNINIEKDDVDFDYVYGITATVNVKDKSTQNSLYSFSETLLEDTEKHSSGNKNIAIDESVNVDYNHFNEVVKSFVSLYELDTSESTLTISLHVKTTGACKEFEKDENLDSVVSIVIPLTTKTMAIDIENDLVDNDYKVLVCPDKASSIIYLISAFIIGICDIVLVIGLVKFINNTRTEKDKYNKELKRILSDYHLYIQKVNNNFELKGYQLVVIDTFDDMLEIRDTLNQPILMVESPNKNGVHFIIPSNTKLLYTYTLKAKKEVKTTTKKSKK